MKTFLAELISDGQQPSTGRVMALLIVGCVMLVWTVLSIRTGQMIVPDVKIVSLVIAAVSGKTLQSFAENLPTKTTP